MTTENFNNLILRPFNNMCLNLNTFFTRKCLEEHNVLNGYLCIEIFKGKTLEIPAPMLSYFEFISACPNIKFEQIAMPLFYTKATCRTTSESIINQSFVNTSVSNDRLSKIITKKGDIYYGGNGMIFDEDMNPLILYTVTVTDMVFDNEFLQSRKKAIISDFNVRVSPKIFFKDTALKKYILNKVIPSLIFNNFNYMRGIRYDENKTPKVIIEDLSKWIKKPEKAGNPQTFKEDMSNFLSRPDIIQDIINCL